MLKIGFPFTIRRYEVILAIIILLLTGSVVVSSHDPSLDSPRRYPYRIALTFDDGPHPAFTEKILSLLRDYDVPATFFVVGSQAVKYPHLARALARGGHEMEGHTFTHRNLARLSDAEITKELSTTRRLLSDISGEECACFRPPGGQYDRRVVALAGEMGLAMVLWTVFPKDHEENDPAVIVDRVLAQAQDGGVVILHSGRAPTIAALPRIIAELRRRGYRFVTVSAMRSQRPPSPAKLAWLKTKESPWGAY